jgi:hypothetical protein
VPPAVSGEPTTMAGGEGGMEYHGEMGSRLRGVGEVESSPTELSMSACFRRRGMVGCRSDQCSPVVAVGLGRHAEHGWSSGRRS